MALPFATTTITVLRAPPGSDLDDPYEPPPVPVEVATGVPAVIYAPTGREVVAGGEQTLTQLRLTCELTDLRAEDTVRDDLTQIVYRVVWCLSYPGEHTEAGLKLVEGLV